MRLFSIAEKLSNEMLEEIRLCTSDWVLGYRYDLESAC